MKRPRPAPFKLATLVSAALCAVAVVAWANSFRAGEYFPPGFLCYKWHPTRATPQIQCVALVLGALTVSFALLSLRARWVLHRRRIEGLCPACGYDLRATPDRCPECGTVPASK